MDTADPVLYPSHSALSTQKSSVSPLICIFCYRSLLSSLPCSIPMDTKTTSPLIDSTVCMICGISALSQSSHCLHCKCRTLLDTLVSNYLNHEKDHESLPVRRWRWLDWWPVENISRWYDSHSPSEMVFFLLCCVPDSFSYSLKGTIFLETITENRNPKGRLFPRFHCNLFSCLETPSVVLRTGCLSFLISFPQRITYRLIHPPLNWDAHLTHKDVLLGSTSQVS